MDRKIYSSSFTQSDVLSWQCPTCSKSLLEIRKDSFKSEQTGTSRKYYDEVADWDPEWTRYVYSCLLDCTNRACNEVVASSGVGGVGIAPVFKQRVLQDIEYDDFFTPKYFSPHLKIFDFSSATPKEISVELETSFELFFCDPPSAANHVRIAIENLLTHLGIKRFNIENKKYKPVVLHNRIELLPSKYGHLKDLFLAMKWLGNAGSHSGKTLTTDDVLDSYEIMEEVLRELFEKKQKKIKTLAKKINKKKGPK
ncbi:MAG: DUF4145 domain-containing protein [Deltaproteobacteria bacterium]|nr:DUF4145 domain-containing protein [Deltaproteobacteria bacterium]